MAGTTLRNPVHRRPSWAVNDASYRHYMRKGLAADRSPGLDYGLDNFSYDEAHLSKWKAPESLTNRLPPQMRAAINDWEYGGAAVCTALERIEKLDADSIHRAYPDKSAHGHLSRRVSNQSPAVAGAETPLSSSPMSPPPSMSSSLLPLEKMSFEGLPQRRVEASPPFTPTDSQAWSSPEFRGRGIPDVNSLTRQLSPMSMVSRSNSVTSSAIATPIFDQNAWEVYLGTYRAELQDIRQFSMARFRGFGYSIDRLRTELGQDREHKVAIEDFNTWWAEMKPKISEYDEKVRQLELPTLDRVKAERVSQSLPI